MNRKSIFSILIFVLFVQVFAFAQPGNLQVKNDTLVEKNGNRTALTITNRNDVVIEIIRLKNGKKHGKQEIFWDNGKPKEISHYKKGLLDGEKLSYDGQSRLYKEENFKAIPEKNKSVLHGEVKTYRQGKLIGEFKFRNGEKNGKYRLYYPSGTLKEKGTYENNLKKGPVKYYNNNGNLARDQYFAITTNDKGEKVSVLDGHIRYFSHDSQISLDCYYKLGKKHGVCKEYSNGKEHYLESLNTYKNDLRHGRYAYYYPSGNIKREGSFYEKIIVEGDTLANVYEGKIASYFPAGKVEKLITWKNYRKNGPTVYYYENGQIYHQLFFKDNLQTGMEGFWDEKGNKTMEIPYSIIEKDSVKVSVKDGVEKRWKNGKLVYTTEYENGKKNGLSKEYFPNGQLKSLYHFKNGQLHGSSVSYYENGTIRQKRNYLASENDYEEFGWNYNFDENGQTTMWFYADEKGKKILFEKKEKGKKSSLRIIDILKIQFLPPGKPSSFYILRSNSLPLLGYDFYSNKKLRNIHFLPPKGFRKKTVNLSSNGKVLQVISEDDDDENLDKTVEKLVQQFNPDWLTSDLFTDETQEGGYNLAYADGSPFLQIQFKDSLPHGTWIVFGPLKKDTILRAEFDRGKKVGKWLKKRPGGIPIFRTTYGKDEIVLRSAYYYDNGNLKKRDVRNPDGTQKSLEEYYENGNLKRREDYTNKTNAHYKENGNLLFRTYIKPEPDSIRIIERYYPEKDQLRKKYYTNLSTKEGYVKLYYENGQLWTSHEMFEEEEHGAYKKLDKEGNLLVAGNFKAGKRHGTWKEFEKGKLTESSYFENGEIVIDPASEKACACYDRSMRNDEVGFANKVDYMAGFEEVLSYFPAFIVPHEKLNIDDLFYINFRFSTSRSTGFYSMDLLMYDEFSFYLPANKQVKINLNPCMVEGYISNMGANFNLNTELKKLNSASFQTNRIAISLVNNPLKTLDGGNFTGYFDVSSVYINEKNIKIDYKSEANACFGEGLIKDFIHLKVKKAEPLIEANRTYPSVQLPINDFPVLKTEAEGFYGFAITEASLVFDYVENNKSIPVKAMTDKLFAGSDFVAAEIKIKGEKTSENTFELAGSQQKIDLSLFERFLEQKGLYRLNIQYNEKEKALTLQFFAQ